VSYDICFLFIWILISWYRTAKAALSRISGRDKCFSVYARAFDEATTITHAIYTEHQLVDVLLIVEEKANV
jgi:hypothetical protein